MVIDGVMFTIRSISNYNLVEDIHNLDTSIRSWTNSGHLDYAKGFTLRLFSFDALYNQNDILIFVSMEEVSGNITISMDIYEANTLVLHVNNYKALVFKKILKDLYKYDLQQVNTKQLIC